jgi:hypothetical protein
MGIAQWMRVIDTISGLAQMTGRLLPKAAPEGGALATQEPGVGRLETHLAGVVVSALKEAFDRDRTRMDLERAQIESERRRVEEALATEIRRQASERALSQLRLIAVMAVAAWMLSAALAVWLPGMRAGIPRALLGAGWLLAFAALGCTFASWQYISEWTMKTASATSGTDSPTSAAASAAPWTLLLALAAIGGSLLAAL